MMYRRELTREELQARVPSVFADTASENTSARYLQIPTHRIVDAMIKADFIPVAAKQTRSKDSEHAKHVIHFSHKSIAAGGLKNPGDELPLIRVQNSHDAKSSFQIDTGFFRLVCSNGLVMPSKTWNSARIVHKQGMENDVIEASYRVLDSFGAQVDQVQTMKAVQLDGQERTLLAQSASRLMFTPEQLEANAKWNRPVENVLLRARRNADQQNDLWTTFNRIQENVIKGGQRVYNIKGEARAMREVNSIDREKQINVELMLLAQKMAELKGAIAA